MLNDLFNPKNMTICVLIGLLSYISGGVLIDIFGEISNTGNNLENMGIFVTSLFSIGLVWLMIKSIEAKNMKEAPENIDELIKLYETEAEKYREKSSALKAEADVLWRRR